jgi:hypothetical protein
MDLMGAYMHDAEVNAPMQRAVDHADYEISSMMGLGAWARWLLLRNIAVAYQGAQRYLV